MTDRYLNWEYGVMSKEEKISAKFHSLLQFFVAEKQSKTKKTFMPLC